jgi:hypothetical protein
LSEGQRLLGVLVVIVAVGTGVVTFGSRLLGLAAGPEPEILIALKQAESRPDAQRVGPMTVRKLGFARLTVLVEPGGERAVVVGTLDFEGTYGDGPLATAVSSLGFERVPFVKKDGAWAPEASWAPRLELAVDALERRRRALETLDPKALERLSGGADAGLEGLQPLAAMRSRSLKVRAWYLRSEPEGLQAAEEAVLTGDLPERPVHDSASRRLNLRWNGREFFFPQGFL